MSVYLKSEGLAYWYRIRYVENDEVIERDVYTLSRDLKSLDKEFKARVWELGIDKYEVIGINRI